MLKDYAANQPIAYNILKNAIKKKKIPHAYLFSANNKKELLAFTVSFAKTLICPNNFFAKDDCQNCQLCERIDSGNFPELKIIEPDGLWIKKDQLLELQEEFKTKSLEGDKKIYLINGVEKLNVQAANSILKFLEEPEPNIFALLTTTDPHNVLPTILSRCQLIALREVNDSFANDSAFADITNVTMVKIGKMYYRETEEIAAFAKDEESIKKVESVIRFIEHYESHHLGVLIDIKKLWTDIFTDKESAIRAFDIMALFYKDVLSYMYHTKVCTFDTYREAILIVANSNHKEDIIYKMQQILITKEKIKYNINLSLLMDKLVLSMEKKEKHMIDVVGISFEEEGRVYYFSPAGFEVNVEDYVIVETERGLQFGKVMVANSKMKKENLNLPLRLVIRTANDEDKKNHERNLIDGSKALKECHRLIEKNKLTMNLVDASYTFDRRQLLFHFTADSRIDFRELAKELASLYRTRIELRQVGIRDKARSVGGIGPCGRMLCCTTFLYDFESVSISMAKNQNIALNPNKINGACGRLLCCLTYENEAYEDAKKDMPEYGQIVKIKEGTGRVISLDLLNGTYRVDVAEHGIVTVDKNNGSN